MRVEEVGRHADTKRVGNVKGGTAVKFCAKFHPEMETSDVYLVIDTAGSYYPDDAPREQCRGVVRLSDGKLSFVCNTREVRLYHAKAQVSRRFEC